MRKARHAAGVVRHIDPMADFVTYRSAGGDVLPAPVLPATPSERDWPTEALDVFKVDVGHEELLQVLHCTALYFTVVWTNHIIPIIILVLVFDQVFLIRRHASSLMPW